MGQELSQLLLGLTQIRTALLATRQPIPPFIHPRPLPVRVHYDVKWQIFVLSLEEPPLEAFSLLLGNTYALFLSLFFDTLCAYYVLCRCSCLFVLVSQKLNFGNRNICIFFQSIGYKSILYYLEKVTKFYLVLIRENAYIYVIVE